MFKIELCKSKGAYEVKPIAPVRLSLARIKNRFNTRLATPVLVVIDYDGEIVVHQFGKLFFKTLKDMERIKSIAEEIYSHG
jgi:hypothetical protein